MSGEASLLQRGWHPRVTTHVASMGPEELLLGGALLGQPESFRVVARSDLRVLWLPLDMLQGLLTSAVRAPIVVLLSGLRPALSRSCVPPSGVSPPAPASAPAELRNVWSTCAHAAFSHLPRTAALAPTPLRPSSQTLRPLAPATSSR